MKSHRNFAEISLNLIYKLTNSQQKQVINSNKLYYKEERCCHYTDHQKRD